MRVYVRVVGHFKITIRERACIGNKTENFSGITDRCDIQCFAIRNKSVAKYALNRIYPAFQYGQTNFARLFFMFACLFFIQFPHLFAGLSARLYCFARLPESSCYSQHF